MIKVLLVFGTRPEAIKMAPLVLEMKKYPKQITPIICVTGQHRDMLDQVLTLFQITPDYDLEIMKANQDLFDIFTNTMQGMKNVLDKSKPDLVLVHGDTSSSSAAALSAFYFKIPVGHVEAGLRTNNRYNPWPEEMNRQINGRIATYHFAPTNTAAENLLNEQVAENGVFVTGNTVIDSLHLVGEKIEASVAENQNFVQQIISSIPPEPIHNWIAGNRKMVLITAHRRENFGEGFSNVFLAIKNLAEKYPSIDFVFPIHLNPAVRNAAEEVFKVKSNTTPNLFFTEPLSYLPFVFLLKFSCFVMTDSGGIQEEAPGFGKPVLVFRETTERPEAVLAGTVALVGTDTAKISELASKLLDDPSFYQKMSHATNPYGDGLASYRIVQKIIELFSHKMN